MKFSKSSQDIVRGFEFKFGEILEGWEVWPANKSHSNFEVSFYNSH